MADQALPLRRTRRAGRAHDTDGGVTPVQTEHMTVQADAGPVSGERADPALIWLLFTVAAVLIAAGIGLAAYKTGGDWLLGLGVSGPVFVGARLFFSLVLKV